MTVGFVVGEDGIPRHLGVVSRSDEGLDEAAINAVSQWRYKPGRISGTVTPLPVVVEVVFPASVTASQKAYSPSRTETTNQVQEQFRLPKPVHLFEADYPVALIGSGLEGLVIVRVRVDIAGVPHDAKVVKTFDSRFNKAAIAAAQEFRFEPAQRNGKEVEMAALIEVRFAHPQPEAADRVATAHGMKSGSYRLRSPNFSVIAEQRDNPRLGQLLLALERARALFKYLYGVAPGGTVTILVKSRLTDVQDQCETRHGQGCYIFRGGNHTILLSQLSIKDRAAETAVHEYSHLAQQLREYKNTPAWINEGLAKYFESLRMKGGKIFVGYFDPRQRLPAWLHVESVLQMDYRLLGQSMSRQSNQAFYAQSHLLIHMMRHSNTYKPGLNKFFDAVKSGTESAQAFMQVYGISTNRLHKDLTDYYQRSEFQRVEFFSGLDIPSQVVVDEPGGRQIRVKESKCSWCTAGKILRRMPIIIPIPLFR